MKYETKYRLKNRALGILIMLSAFFYLSYPLFPVQTKDALYLDGCIFKSATHLPCPGCGYSRAINEITLGHWSEALRFNMMLPFLIGLALLFAYFGFMAVLKGKLTSLSKKTTYAILALVIVSWILKFIMGPDFY